MFFPSCEKYTLVNKYYVNEGCCPVHPGVTEMRTQTSTASVNNVKSVAFQFDKPKFVNHDTRHVVSLLYHGIYFCKDFVR